MIHPGKISGTIVGGNIGSLNILQGTEYMPSMKNAILFLEDNYPMAAEDLDRHIHSLILQQDFPRVKGIVLGRFQVDSKITHDLVRIIVDSKAELKKIPIIAEADFGHTLPMFTFPIGGEIELESGQSGVTLKLIKR